MPNGKQTKERTMPLVKVGPKHQVVIPKEVRNKLGVSPGDYVEVAFRRNQAVIKRKRIVDDFPYTDEPIGPKTRTGVLQGLKDIEDGNVSGLFRTAAEVQRHLDSLKK
jgi:AbrB family looped-hinge helix DNA binding protein